MRKAAIATRIALRTLGGGTVGVVLGFTFNGIHLWALAGEAQACAPDPVALCKSDALLGYSFDSVLIAYAATIVICIIGFVLIQWRTVPATAPLAVIVTWLLLRSYSSRLGDTLILAESPRCGSEASYCRARRWSRQTRRSRQRCHCEKAPPTSPGGRRWLCTARGRWSCRPSRTSTRVAERATTPYSPVAVEWPAPLRPAHKKSLPTRSATARFNRRPIALPVRQQEVHATPPQSPVLLPDRRNQRAQCCR